MDFMWQSVYFEEKNNKHIEIGRDEAHVRSFTLHEIEIFLSLNGFEIIKSVARPTYAFPTYVMIAKKCLYTLLG